MMMAPQPRRGAHLICNFFSFLVHSLIRLPHLVGERVSCFCDGGLWHLRKDFGKYVGARKDVLDDVRWRVQRGLDENSLVSDLEMKGKCVMLECGIVMQKGFHGE